MLKKGNADTNVTVNNLLAMKESECILDRMRGMRTDMLDHAADIEDIESDILDTIEAYEPRAKVISIGAEIGTDGDMEISLEIENNYDDEDESTNDEIEEEALDDAGNYEEG